MGHHSSGTERFFSELIRPSNLPKLAVFVSVFNKAWISGSRPFIDAAHGPLHSVHSPPAAKRASPPCPSSRRPRPSSPRSRPLPRPERCRCPLPDATASLVRCQHDATASLARCQLPAIPHVGKVGVGVSRPQRTTAMPTSSAIQDAAAATVPAPIRIAYK
ncbi:hypothetical protein ACLOJK_030832 [Asimina triloba]